MHEVEIRTIAKVSKRLVPFLIVCYFVAYLDRVNVGFAALTMNQDFGWPQPGLGSGPVMFSIVFSIFEGPPTILRNRWGPRNWIARIMRSWGTLPGPRTFTPAIARATG